MYYCMLINKAFYLRSQSIVSGELLNVARLFGQNSIFRLVPESKCSVKIAHMYAMKSCAQVMIAIGRFGFLISNDLPTLFWRCCLLHWLRAYRAASAQR